MSLQSKSGSSRRSAILNPSRFIQRSIQLTKACLELVSATGAIFCYGRFISIGVGQTLHQASEWPALREWIKNADARAVDNMFQKPIRSLAFYPRNIVFKAVATKWGC